MYKQYFQQAREHVNKQLTGKETNQEASHCSVLLEVTILKKRRFFIPFYSQQNAKLLLTV